MSPAIDFRSLLREHSAVLWGLCYRMTGSAADADDLVQETFRRAFEQAPDPSRPLRPWLMTVATRLSIDALRRRRRRDYVGPWLPQPIDDETAHEGADPEQRYQALESLSYGFLVALEELSPAQRATLVLCDAFGFSGPETAEMLGMSPQNVRKTLSRARAVLAAHEAEPPMSASEPPPVLARLIQAVLARDVAATMACLAGDARLTSDGAGHYHAALKPIHGPDRVARFLVGVQSKGGRPQAFEVRRLGGAIAVVAVTEPPSRRVASRSLTMLDLDASGLVRRVYIVLAPEKLDRVRFPGEAAEPADQRSRSTPNQSR